MCICLLVLDYRLDIIFHLVTYDKMLIVLLHTYSQPFSIRCAFIHMWSILSNSHVVSDNGGFIT